MPVAFVGVCPTGLQSTALQHFEAEASQRALARRAYFTPREGMPADSRRRVLLRLYSSAYIDAEMGESETQGEAAKAESGNQADI